MSKEIGHPTLPGQLSQHAMRLRRLEHRLNAIVEAATPKGGVTFDVYGDGTADWLVPYWPDGDSFTGVHVHRLDSTLDESVTWDLYAGATHVASSTTAFVAFDAGSGTVLSLVVSGTGVDPGATTPCGQILLSLEAS